jgi:hypothetical protein
MSAFSTAIALARVWGFVPVCWSQDAERPDVALAIAAHEELAGGNLGWE